MQPVRVGFHTDNLDPNDGSHGSRDSVDFFFRLCICSAFTSADLEEQIRLIRMHNIDFFDKFFVCMT